MRYQSRISQYQQNCTFKNNQGTFNREINSGGETTEVPDKSEAQEFWASTLGKKKKHQIHAQWPPENLKRDFEYKEEQEKVDITPD